MRYVRPHLPSNAQENGRQARGLPRISDPKRLRTRMVHEQLKSRGIHDLRVLAAMAEVPRHLFVPEALAPHAYDDSPLPIGFGQTISQPFMVALMTELLEAYAGMRVMEIGTGCGYQAAILAKMGCVVYSVERLRELFNTTSQRISQMGLRSVYIKLGDGTLGLPHVAPFDRIIVSAGAPLVPAPLVDQLGENGIMVIPAGAERRSQRLLRVYKSRGKTSVEDFGPATFVDLIGSHGWHK